MSILSKSEARANFTIKLLVVIFSQPEVQRNKIYEWMLGKMEKFDVKHIHIF